MERCAACGRPGGWLLRIGDERWCATCAPPNSDLFAANPAPSAQAELALREAERPYDPWSEWT